MTDNNRVTVLCADVSINCLSRALTLAEIISHRHDVRIAGFSRNAGAVWQPAEDSRIPVDVMPYGTIRHWRKACEKIARLARESKLIICKPRLLSMGLALQAGIRPDRVILDINDWELGLALDSRRADGRFYYHHLLKNPVSPNSPLLAMYIEKKISRFPLRLVNNRWLQQRFGGELLYDVRDTERLDPDNYDREALRKSLGLSERPWIIFAGTPRPHKGLHVLIHALAGISTVNAPGLMCCGGGSDYSQNAAFLQEARQLLGPERVFHAGQFKREDAAAYLAAADIACIPALLTSNTVGQVPTKLFEAMAMGLPLVTSAICDMPQLVEGIGFPVPPGDINALGMAIEKLSINPDLCIEMGKNARVRAVERYSYHAAEPVIESLLEKMDM